MQGRVGDDGAAAVETATARGGGPTFLNDERLKVVLFGGKGGVGKTTAAAATALYCAHQRPRARILLVSTDPAHSLGDSLARPIGDVVTCVGPPNLFAQELDAVRRLEAFRVRYGEVLKVIASRGTFMDDEDIDQFFALSLPGMDEFMAALELARLVHTGAYDLLILDTAPTGHTLRLLGLPTLMEQWIHTWDCMLAKHRYMLQHLGRWHPDEADAFLQQMRQDTALLRNVLSDQVATEFVPVTIPEAMSVDETVRLVGQLKEWGVRVRSVVVNRIEPPSQCPYCEARYTAQLPYLSQLAERFPEQQMFHVPLMRGEVRGQAGLRLFAEALSDGIASCRWPAQAEWQSPALSRATGAPESSPRRPSRPSSATQPVPMRTLLLFGGKGGVGKTTLATATALHISRHSPQGKVLLFSTDPAHSLSDSLCQPIGNQITPVKGSAGLYGLEMDAAALLEEFRLTYVAEINEMFDALLGGVVDATFDRRVMEELVMLTPPGIDELMALMRIMELIGEYAFEYYVLDLAPTGHALRFVEMPALARAWFVVFFKLMLKYQAVVRLNRVAELLVEKSKQLRQVHKLLLDGARCEFVVVTIPEKMAVEETRRLVAQLSALKMPCRRLFVNMVRSGADCERCRARGIDQEPYLVQLRGLGLEVSEVRQLPREVRGLQALEEIGEAIYGHAYA